MARPVDDVRQAAAITDTLGRMDPAEIRHVLDHERLGPLPLRRLAARQSGLVARRQLAGFGVDADAVRNQLAAGRWVARTPRVLALTTGALSPTQRRWLGVLHAGPRAVLGGLTAAELHGLRRWERDEVTVVVDDELAFEPVEGVRFFRSRRPLALLRDPDSPLPACRLQTAALLWAAYDAPGTRSAYGVVAATVQQRLADPDDLLDWVRRLKPLRRAPLIRGALQAAAGGSHSAAEADVRRLCTEAGLVLPAGQRRRVDATGRERWTDCEWDLPDGRVLVLEVDGAFHLDVLHADGDNRRTRRLVGPGTTVVRCTTYEVRYEPAQLVRDLRALGVPSRAPAPAPRVPGDAA